MTLFKAHVIFGLFFDFLFVQWKVGTELLKTDPNALTSWAMQLYNITKFYIVTLGILSVAMAFLIPQIGRSMKLDWTIFNLFAGGTLLIIWAGIWYTRAGQSIKWETRCTVLTFGLLFIVISLGFEIYKALSAKGT